MYWALEGSELGSDCMLILRQAYADGCGVIQDTEKCMKWLILASTLGN